MKMWSVGVLILLLFCYACLSIESGNGRVRFISKNFNNTLHWEAVEPAYPGEEMLYSVQYWSDATGQYQIKEECQNITDLLCDLTAETPSLPDLYYHARVSVNGHLLGRTDFRFSPLEHTVLGQPTLLTHTTGSSLYVNVTLPLGPKGASIADIISNSKHGYSKTAVVYTLKITKPHWAALVNKTTTGRFVINLKNNKTQYCGFVVYRPISEWGRKESENASFCITFPDNHQMILTWLFASAGLLVAIITMSVVWMCNYVRGGKKTILPPSLETNFGNSCKVQSPDRCITSIPVVSTANEPTVYATIQVKPNVSVVRCGGYSPQEIPSQAWQGNTGSSVDTLVNSLMPQLLDVSAQSSEIYSAVAAHVPAEGNEDVQQPTMEARDMCTIPLPCSTKLIVAGVPPSPDVDDCDSNSDGPLLLHTVLDTNGQLTLPSLTMLQRSIDNMAPPLLSDVITFNMETPFLASFQRFDSSEWSDSGCDDSSVNTATQQYCNTHYFPSQPVSPYSHQPCQLTQCSIPNFESGYKQNWMPAILLQSASKDGCEYIRTNNH
ncbi:Tissue fac domain containing [Solea senegalensis]|uniref:Tissue fac domain containing n=1 Tax=Solea senegalensis TaxID=28829 RepID=A0AAV6PXP0_SOLSE|nr:interferon lambda receptor 1 [Solea senegalensis]KAG7476243.1 Tissue fac domain containing [Solea senegalensis]